VTEAVCRKCGEFKKIKCRMLCHRCISKPAGPDEMYHRAMEGSPRGHITADVVTPWVHDVIAENGGKIDQAALDCRVDTEVLRRLVKGTKSYVTTNTADLIAMASGHISELGNTVDGLGADGWSEFGRWCGDMSPLSDGCGTWHHEHVANGLCGECCMRYSGLLDVEARDVRVARELGA
jgi:hypothetical protein